MKNKRHIISRLLLLAFGTLLVLASCSKERQCKCSYADEDNSLKFIFVDNGMNCENITEIAEEVHVTETTTMPPRHTLDTVNVHKVKCRSYGGD